MAAKGRGSSSSCLSFLKEALLLPTRNAKLFVPVFVLVAAPTLLTTFVSVLAVQPLAADVIRLLDEMKNTDPSSAEYARLMEVVMKELKEMVFVAVGLVVVAAVLSFVKLNVAFFAAATTYSGDRYSLAELLKKVVFKGNRFVGPSVTIAMSGVLLVACFVFLAWLLQLVTGHSSGAVSLAAGLAAFALAFLAFLYLTVVFVVAVAVSAADAGRRGAGALREAWRLMTRVRRKEACALVVVVHLLPMAAYPLYAAALGYAKRSTAVAAALLAAYSLLSGAAELFSFAAATVFYYQATESKEGTAPDGYVKIPTAEETV